MHSFIDQTHNNKHNNNRVVDLVQNGWALLTRSTGMFMYPWIHAMAFARSGLHAEELGNDIQLHLQVHFFTFAHQTRQIVPLC
jgi:hypothetical protein